MALLDFFKGLRETPPQVEKAGSTAVPSARPTPLSDEAFLAFLSHELRTPLNAIIGYSEILQEDAAFLEQKDFIPDLQKIQRASEHLMTLIDDVVDLSRIEADRMPVQVEEFRPADLVRDVVNDTRSLVDRTFCTLEAVSAPDVPTMKADRAKVQRALSNIVRHVCGLARQGTMRLEVSSESSSLGPAIRFSLLHSDLVLKPREIEALLEAGTQASAGLPQYHGSGLGLVIAQRFCRLQGGDFSVRLAEDGGVVLTMLLPREVVRANA